MRDHLLGRVTDRPPFLPSVLDFAAALAHATRADLLRDPQALSSALGDLLRLCPFDGIVISVRAEELPRLAGTGSETPTIEVCADALGRLRSLWQDNVGLGVLLPGPMTVLAVADDGASDARAHERVTTTLLQLAQALDPPRLDVLGLCEAVAMQDDDLVALQRVLAPLWNAIGFYSMPSLFAAAHAGCAAGAVGARAVSVWSGCTPSDLLESGAARVGVPVDPALAGLPEPVAGGFFMSAGELPADTDIDWLVAIAGEVALLEDPDGN